MLFKIVCSNNTIIVYEYETGAIINVFQGHSNFIHSLIYNPNPTKFVFYTASEDGTVRAWDIVLNK
jgi:WD40 repeat protein